MTLKVSNLTYKVTEQDLKEFISQYATVTRVVIPTDRETGRVRGFAFVDLENPEQENSVISAMNGVEFMGRQLRVLQAIAKRSIDSDSW
jgi:RNA recognition motif-containing protein